MSDYEAGIVDLQVRGILETHGDRLHTSRGLSEAFTVLCLRTLLQMDDEEALSCLTEGGGDASIDAMYLQNIDEYNVTVILVQSKYSSPPKVNVPFPFNDVVKLSAYIDSIFVKQADLEVNPRLRAKLAELQASVKAGAVVQFRVLCCNNGQAWSKTAAPFTTRHPDKIVWEHINHETIIRLLQTQQSGTNGNLRFSGRFIQEQQDFIGVVVGKVPVIEIRRLFDEYGDALLEQNVRRYLGPNRVNSEIRESLKNPETRKRFYFYNNGITSICRTFMAQDIRDSDPIYRFEGMQIINGGQTCKTIQQTLKDFPEEDFSGTHVLFRMYSVGSADGDSDLISNITKATNNQSNIELSDLRSNDPKQKTLEMAVRLLGYVYRTKRGVPVNAAGTITSVAAAEAILTIWRRKPHAAKFRKLRLFDEFYQEIFSGDLNAAQLVLAVLVFQAADLECRNHIDSVHDDSEDDGDEDDDEDHVDDDEVDDDSTGPSYRFIPYASHFIAMIMGWELLGTMGISLGELNHTKFAYAHDCLRDNAKNLYRHAVDKLRDALRQLEISEQSPLPRLAGVFRRTDVLELLINPESASAPAGDVDLIVTVSRAGHATKSLRDNPLPVPELTKGDFVVAQVGCGSGNNIMIFDSKGVVHTIGVDAISNGHDRAISRDAGPISVVNALSCDPRFIHEFYDQKPELGPEYEAPYPHVFVVTQSGRCLRLSLWPYQKVSKKGGRRYVRLAEGDRVMSIVPVYADDSVAIVTRRRLSVVESMAAVCVVSQTLGRRLLKEEDDILGAWNISSSDVVHLIGPGGDLCGKELSDIVYKAVTTGTSLELPWSVKRVKYDISPPDFEIGKRRLNDLFGDIADDEGDDE